MRPIRVLVKFTARLLIVFLKYTIVLGLLLFLSLVASGYLSQRYESLYRDVYVLPRSEAETFLDWKARIDAAIKTSEQDKTVRDLLYIVSYPCMRSSFLATESELTRVNGDLAHLIRQTEALSVWQDRWLEKENEEDGMLMAPPDDYAGEAFGVARESEDYRLYVSYLEWRAARDNLREQLDALAPQVAMQRQAFMLTIAKGWDGLSAMTGASLDAIQELWAWGMRKVQST